MLPHVNTGKAKKLLVLTWSRWSDHNAPRLGAALAYYSLLSMAPLSILIVAICGLVFGKAAAEQDVLGQTQALVGKGGADVLKNLIDSAHQPGAGIFATGIALVTLLFGASGVFLELRDALDNIWDTPPQKSSGWRQLIWQRLAAFGMVLGLGFFLLLSLALSAAFALVQKFATGIIPLPAAVTGEALNLAISLLALSVLFALLFKVVPEVRVDWQDVAIGGVATAVMFNLGKLLLGIYLSTAGVGSTYGAAGSLVALVVWVYYSAQIFFFGAVFTRVYAEEFGSRKRATVEDHVA